MISFHATVMEAARGATVAATGGGYRVGLDGRASAHTRLPQALNAVRDYFGAFLQAAERNRDLAWSLTVSVAAGSAFYGTRAPQLGGSGVPVAPAEELAKIRARYREGDGPIAALQNALQIARAYPPVEEAA